MRILGLNSAFHENSAALIVDGQVICAVEEERFNRIKHGSSARVDNPHELPAQSIRYCLEQGKLQASDLDAVCFGFDPELRLREWRPDPYALADDWGHPEGEQTFYNNLLKIPGTLSELLGTDLSSRFRWVPHHMAHAASAFYPSNFDKAAILVVDGIGEDATALLAFGDGARIESLQHIPMPNSLGFLWEKFSKFLGFSEYDASQVMGLAGYGNPDIYREHFSRFLQYNADGTFNVNNDVLQFRQPNCDSLVKLFGALDGHTAPCRGQKGRDIAATLQAVTNEIILALAAHLYAQRPCDSLCLAGGVALNCRTNWIVKEQGPFQNVYIPSAPHDAGTAIGAALCFHYNQTERAAAGLAPASRATSVMPHPYTGPSFTDEEIEEILGAQPLPVRKSSDVAKEVAELISAGNIVAWFQGGMELGPRALGNRSLLGDPRDRNVREVMNRKVKHRELFRPFAPSVLEEVADEWFEIGKPSESARYMLFACPVPEDKRERIPAVIHVDDTARVQTVSKDLNPKFHELISRFYEITGVPMLLNTSFNDSEPIVCTPQDALNTFNKTRIDVLVLGNYMVRRNPAEHQSADVAESSEQPEEMLTAI